MEGFKRNGLNYTQCAYDAIQAGDRELVVFLKNRPIDINHVFADGRTLFHYGLCKGYDFFNFKPDIRISTSDNLTPLYLACQDDNIEFVRKLLELGAKIDTNSVLLIIQKGNLEIFKLFITKGLDKNSVAQTPFVIKAFAEYYNDELHRAAHFKNIQHCKELLDKGADINTVFGLLCRNKANLFAFDYNPDINLPDKDGNTPLFNACLYKEIVVIEELIKRNVKIDEKTVLYVAHEFCHEYEEVMKLLVNAGVKETPEIINSCTCPRHGPILKKLFAISTKKLHELIIARNIPEVKKHLDTENINEVVDGKTAFHLMCSLAGDEFLFAFKLSPKINLKCGNDTPLYVAVSNKNLSFVNEILRRNPEIDDASLKIADATCLKFFIEIGLDYKRIPENHIDDVKNCLLQAAFKKHNVECVKFALDKGADVNLIFWGSCAYGERYLFLFDYKPDVNMVDDGRSILLGAAFKKNIKFVEKLIEFGANIDNDAIFRVASTICSGVGEYLIIFKKFISAGIDENVKDKHNKTIYDYINCQPHKEEIKRSFENQKQFNNISSALKLLGLDLPKDINEEKKLKLINILKQIKTDKD